MRKVACIVPDADDVDDTQTPRLVPDPACRGVCSAQRDSQSSESVESPAIERLANCLHQHVAGEWFHEQG